MRYARAILLLCGLGYLATGLTQVRTGERAVVRRFGRVVAKPGPGLWIGFPAGIDRVDTVPVDLVRRVRVGFEPETADLEPAAPPGQLLSGDYNLVNIQAIVDYAVRDDNVEDFVVNADRVEGAIARAAEATIAQWIAARRVDDVLIRGKSDLPEFLVTRTEEKLEPYRLGVHILGVSIPHLLPPDEVKSAFDDVTRAQTAVRTREHEARQEAARRMREAQAEAERIRQLTGAYVREQHVSASAEAASFEHRLDQYQRLQKQNPDILASIWWEEIGRLLTRLRENGRLDLLDNHLAGDGLDITIAPPGMNKR
jgi:membrane protease subunit HflK